MAEQRPQILDHRGEVIPPRGTQEFRKYKALNGPGWTPYDAANQYSDDMALWRPGLLSSDTEVIPYRDRIVSRIRDYVRNDGWGSGIVSSLCDNVIGANLRPIFRPDYRFLRNLTGDKRFDAVWAHEFGRVADANYRAWANDPGRWCDITRQQTIPQMFRLAFRHELVEGDGLGVNRYEPKRRGLGRARYGTALQIIDPDRLSNPNTMLDQMYIRGGVQIDDYGAAIGYHIREAHQGDYYNAYKSVVWKYMPREDEYGRPLTIHNFTRDRADQHRGVGILTPILDRMKMLSKYDRIELQAALINSVMAAYIESPYDPAGVSDAMGTTVDINGGPIGSYVQDMNSGGFAGYQDARAQFHQERRIMFGDARVPTLFPGEKINSVSASHPHSNFSAFEGAFLRNFSAATGLAPQQVSRDYSDANYSSMRAALLDTYKSFDQKRANFTIGFCQQVTDAWLEESIDVDEYPLPAGIKPNDMPEFIEARHAFGWARWIGPARGWVDPVAEKQGAWLGLKMGLSSLEDLAAEQGQDLEEILDQQAMEKRMYEQRDLQNPDWLGGVPTAIPSPPSVATKQETPPQAPSQGNEK